MTKDQKLCRWLRARKRLGLNVRETAEKIGVHPAMAYSWNCGDREIPPARVLQLEAIINEQPMRINSQVPTVGP